MKRVKPAALAKIAKKLGPSDVHIWHFDISVSGHQRQDRQFRARLSPVERLRLAQITHPETRRLYKMAHSMLRHLLAAYFPTPPRRIRLAVGCFGKPALAASGNPIRLHFNLSHSGQRIAIALCRHANLGVDIEKMRKGVKPQTLANRYFAPEEQLLLAACDSAQLDDAFFQLWSLKEAYVKALGKGFQHSFRSFSLDWQSSRPRMLRCGLGSEKAWTLGNFTSVPGYKGAIAVDRCNAHVTHFML